MSWFRNQALSNPKLEEQLRKASKKGALNQVKKCLWRNVHVDAKDDLGFTALHEASQKGNLKVVQYLVQYGKANVEAKNKDGVTALHLASRNGHFELIQYLVRDAMAEIEAKMNKKSTSLHLASRYGHLKVVQYLVRVGKADVNAKTNDGWTALHLASEKGHLDVVQYLVQDGKADVEAKEKDEWTALHLASQLGHLEIVQYLVREGKANVEARTNHGRTALHSASSKGNLEVVQYLVRVGKADVNAKTNDRWTALHWASANGHGEVVQYLVQDGKADVEAKEKDEGTALHYAIFQGHVKVAAFLEHYCNPSLDAVSKKGDTALDLASQRGCKGVAKFLTNPNRTTTSVSPSNSAVAASSLESAAIVVEPDLQTQTLSNLELEELFREASRNENLDQLEKCLRHNVNVNAQDRDGLTASHVASENGRMGVVRRLVRDGKVDIEMKEIKGRTALSSSESTFESTLHPELPGSITSDIKAILHSSTDSTVPEPLVLARTNNPSINSISDHEAILCNRNELQRMRIDLNAEPTSWSIKYIEYCTENFKSKVLGEGAFGKVYYGCDKVLGVQFAVKRVPLMVSDQSILNTLLDSFRREVLVLKRFSHPNIVAMYGYNISSQGASQFLVYEYLANGALSGFLMDDQGRTRLPGHARISIMFQVSRAVNFLHTGGCDNLKIFHRDIKSGNICLTQDYTAKLIDCGMSKFVEEDNKVSHGKSITPTILKPSGAAVFGTLGYICPDYSNGDVSFSAACDVYSMGVVMVELIVGCLQGGQSSRNGKSFGNFSRRYVINKYHERIENGVEILFCDADPTAEWNALSLKLLCDIALQCLSPSPLRRPTSHNLVQRLGEISKIDFRGTLSSNDDPPESTEKASLRSNDEQSAAACVLCHKTEVYSIKCSNMHATCVSCIEQQIQLSIRRCGGDVCCGIVGCNLPHTDDSIYGKVSPSIFKEYVTERGLQKIFDLRLKSLESKISNNHSETMSSLNEIKSVVNRSQKAMAYLAKETGQKCPSLVWMVPAEPIVGHTARDWIKWAKSLTSRRYHVYFICQHSFTAVDVEPRIEIDVPRSWMVQAAPVLRLSLFAIKAALSAFPVGPLPFPVPDLLTKEQLFLYEQFTNSFLDKATTGVLELFESACTNGIDLPQASSSRVITLTGPAYDGIVDKAVKMKRFLFWVQQMQIVVDRHGSPIWIKKEYVDLYS